MTTKTRTLDDNDEDETLILVVRAFIFHLRKAKGARPNFLMCVRFLQGATFRKVYQMIFWGYSTTGEEPINNQEVPWRITPRHTERTRQIETLTSIPEKNLSTKFVDVQKSFEARPASQRRTYPIFRCLFVHIDPKPWSKKAWRMLG